MNDDFEACTPWHQREASALVSGVALVLFLALALVLVSLVLE